MRLILSTCKAEEAESIAQTLLEERLVGSVNILPPCKTVVRFEGEVLTQEECVLLMRTREDLVWRLERRYLELNTYKVPEVASLEIKEWNGAYERWLMEATRTRG
ncbi:MAG: divalent-cation tolerance protein CutA [Armatimonadetes bacterium]|nr:divalent-cation tolerance protein CutA [Armatimonadota bacterium]